MVRCWICHLLGPRYYPVRNVTNPLLLTALSHITVDTHILNQFHIKEDQELLLDFNGRRAFHGTFLLFCQTICDRCNTVRIQLSPMGYNYPADLTIDNLLIPARHLQPLEDIKQEETS